mgnify:CR=1 FL=1
MSWVVLCVHNDDDRIKGKGQSATWNIKQHMRSQVGVACSALHLGEAEELTVIYTQQLPQQAEPEPVVPANTSDLTDLPYYSLFRIAVTGNNSSGDLALVLGMR